MPPLGKNEKGEGRGEERIRKKGEGEKVSPIAAAASSPKEIPAAVGIDISQMFLMFFFLILLLSSPPPTDSKVVISKKGREGGREGRENSSTALCAANIKYSTVVCMLAAVCFSFPCGELRGERKEPVAIQYQSAHYLLRIDLLQVGAEVSFKGKIKSRDRKRALQI